jgi:hypothetical protein
MRMNEIEIEIGTALGHSNLGTITMSPANESNPPSSGTPASVSTLWSTPTAPTALPFHRAAPTHACHASLLQHPSRIQTGRWIANAVSAPLATPSRALLSKPRALRLCCTGTGKLLPCHTILNETVHDAARNNSQSRTTDRRNRACSNDWRIPRTIVATWVRRYLGTWASPRMDRPHLSTPTKRKTHHHQHSLEL